MSATQFMITLIGTPGTRRVNGFVEAAIRFGQQVNVVSYPEVVSDYIPRPRGIVRIDSPGECAETYRLILRAGIEPMEAAGGFPACELEIDRLSFNRGAIHHPKQWFLGFRAILRTLESRWTAVDVRWMSPPRSIITAFDKLACLQLWEKAGLPVPFRYPHVTSYGQLRDLVRERHARLFLKPRYGYSAMGAIVLEWRDSLVRAITSVDIVKSAQGTRLFVSKKPRVILRESEISWLVDTIAAEELVIEEWLPKARWSGCPFDVRVVTIGGNASHAVGRANYSPFTNLNLDATRIPCEELVERLGATWEAIEDLSATAARQLPDAGMLGIDLLIGPRGKKVVLLEANAFGDYLPGLSFKGMSTWEAQLQYFCPAKEAVA